MKQVMNYHKDNGLLNMIRRTDPMITNILLTNVQGTELGGGLIQQATWYLRIYRAQTGAQVYSQTIHAPFTDVYVNNYANGLYIVTAIYNGNTYHAKVYINH